MNRVTGKQAVNAVDLRNKWKNKRLLQSRWSILSKCQMSLPPCLEILLKVASRLFCLSCFPFISLFPNQCSPHCSISEQMLLPVFLCSATFIVAITDAVIKTLNGKSSTNCLHCPPRCLIFFKKTSHLC